jgi:hypothetical protein
MEKVRWRQKQPNGLSASQFGQALGLTDGRISDFVEYHRRVVGTELEFRGNVATEHGIRTEDTSRKVYELLLGETVRDGGFFTDEDHALAASPDGIVKGPSSRPSRILEIKSPFKALYDARKPSNRPFGIPLYYMCQMQGQLALSGASECDFFVFLQKPEAQAVCWRVYFSEEFWAWALPKLVLVGHWIATGLPEGIDRKFHFPPFPFETIRVEPVIYPVNLSRRHFLPALQDPYGPFGFFAQRLVTPRVPAATTEPSPPRPAAEVMSSPHLRITDESQSSSTSSDLKAEDSERILEFLFDKKFTIGDGFVISLDRSKKDLGQTSTCWYHALIDPDSHHEGNSHQPGSADHSTRRITNAGEGLFAFGGSESQLELEKREDWETNNNNNSEFSPLMPTAHRSSPELRGSFLDQQHRLPLGATQELLFGTVVSLPNSLPQPLHGPGPLSGSGSSHPLPVWATTRLTVKCHLVRIQPSSPDGSLIVPKVGERTRFSAARFLQGTSSQGGEGSQSQALRPTSIFQSTKGSKRTLISPIFATPLVESSPLGVALTESESSASAPSVAVVNTLILTVSCRELLETAVFLNEAGLRPVTFPTDLPIPVVNQTAPGWRTTYCDERGVVAETEFKTGRRVKLNPFVVSSVFVGGPPKDEEGKACAGEGNSGPSLSDNGQLQPIGPLTNSEWRVLSTDPRRGIVHLESIVEVDPNGAMGSTAATPLRPQRASVPQEWILRCAADHAKRKPDDRCRSVPQQQDNTERGSASTRRSQGRNPSLSPSKAGAPRDSKEGRHAVEEMSLDELFRWMDHPSCQSVVMTGGPSSSDQALIVIKGTLLQSPHATVAGTEVCCCRIGLTLSNGGAQHPNDTVHEVFSPLYASATLKPSLWSQNGERGRGGPTRQCACRSSHVNQKRRVIVLLHPSERHSLVLAKLLGGLEGGAQKNAPVGEQIDGPVPPLAECEDLDRGLDLIPISRSSTRASFEVLRSLLHPLGCASPQAANNNLPAKILCVAVGETPPLPPPGMPLLNVPPTHVETRWLGVSWEYLTRKLVYWKI